MTIGLTKIQSITVPVGGQVALTFNNIPQTYKDLIVKFSGRATGLDAIEIYINDTSPSGLHRYIDFGGNGGLRNSASANYSFLSGTAETDTHTVGELTIFDYSSTSKFKTIVADNASSPNDGSSYQGMTLCTYASNSAITKVEFITRGNPSFIAYTTATLYGVPDYQETLGIKATGNGSIYQDNSYFYHAYTSSGTFVPTAAIAADILVIAGGGGSGTGGGGAGGVVYHSSQSLTSGTSYAVTVGAGGAAGASISSDGGNGGNSQFASLTAAVGGGGGATYNGNATARVGLNGGSGGGGSSRDTASQGNGGSATSTQGNSGGFASDSVTPGAINGGGGGGAGAAGGTSTNASNGPANGGNGTSTYSDWGKATGFGQPEGGLWYFAGGGRGGRDFKKGGLTGHGSAGSQVIQGRGGGADSDNTRGGSGIVIVRYAKQ